MKDKILKRSKWYVKTKRTAKQKSATKKLIALNKARRKKKK